MDIEVQTKKWGNSLGVIIPAELVARLNIKPEETLRIEVRKGGKVLQEMFGSMKSKKSAEQILKEHRKEFLVSKWMG